MFFTVALRAKPYHIQRLGVVMMMPMYLSKSTTLSACVRPINNARPDRVSQYNVRRSLVFIFFNPLPFSLPAGFLASISQPILHLSSNNPWVILEPFSVIGPVVVHFVRTVFPDVLLCALLALVQMSIGHSRVFVIICEGLCGPTLETFLHVFVPYILIPGNLNMKSKGYQSKGIS